jgi:threonine dehydrogenase-like Zn-dependent dehydrogenase
VTLALQLRRSPLRYAAARTLGGTVPRVLTGAASSLRLATTATPTVDADGWAIVEPIMTGICGSDLGMLSGHTSLYFSGLVSFPLVPGHEILGRLATDCADLPAGTRVVLDPVLGDGPRGLPRDPDRPSNTADSVTTGRLKPGLQTGFCASTGGGWATELAAHRSQLYAVPDDLSDDRAVLTEPLACAVHTALRARVPDGAAVLVVGAGAVGLLLVHALRRLTGAGSITVVAKHRTQQALAQRLGATEVVEPEQALARVRRASRALKVSPERGGDYLLGGVDVAVDATGTRSGLDTALRSTRAGGRVVLSGMPAAGVDLSPVWFRELDLVGAYASADSEDVAGQRRPAFQIALELAGDPALDGLLSATYPLRRWREAVDHALSAGRLGAVKVAFEMST